MALRPGGESVKGKQNDLLNMIQSAVVKSKLGPRYSTLGLFCKDPLLRHPVRPSKVKEKL